MRTSAISGIFAPGNFVNILSLKLCLRRVCLIAACSVSVSVVSEAQKTYQVSTIKSSAPNTAKHTQIRGSKFVSTGTTLEDLIKFAYSVHASQIVGGAAWIHSEKFDTLADPETDKRPSPEELRAMVAELLQDRFQLVLVPEEQKLPVFALVRMNKEPTLKRDDDEGTYLSGGMTPPGSLFVGHGTVADFARFLQRYAPPEIDRPVVDQTGITGLFDFNLRFTPSQAQREPGFGPEDTSFEPPNIFTAIQEQLGLKLKATNAIVKVLRVSSVSLPTSN